MFLKHLRLRNFRNYSELDLNFCPQLNVLYGANAQGKTNLIEAIHFLIMGRSFRTAHLPDLIKKKCRELYVEASFVKFGIEQTLKISYNGSKRLVVHNATPYATLTSLLGLMHGVILAPTDQLIIKGAPALRRRFLDVQIAQVEATYIDLLNRYLSAMQQRNCLLRQRQERGLEIWEEQMAKSAAEIVKQRHQVIVDLNVRLNDIEKNALHYGDEVALEYQNSAPFASSIGEIAAYYLQRWKTLRPREFDLGVTLSGPHKDDMNISVNQLEAQFFASEGQQRSCAALLRLAEWEYLKQKTGVSPFISVDDIGLSLDPQRKEKLLSALAKTGAQLFLTAPHTLALPAVNARCIFLVEAGTAQKTAV